MAGWAFSKRRPESTGTEVLVRRAALTKTRLEQEHIMKTFRNLILLMAVAAMALAPFATAQSTITMSATYYTIGASDQDMGHLAVGVFTNEVQSTLGADGLPVLNTAAYGCSSGCFTNTPLPADLTASGEIAWWSPSLNKGGSGGASDVVQTGTGTITLPYNNAVFFPPNGTGANDGSGYQAAVFSTTLYVPTSEPISFNVGADDSAFVYLDGKAVCQVGGVHINAPGTCTTSTLAAGSHTLQVFYSDLEQSYAALTFGITTSGITNTPPATIPTLSEWGLLLLAGLLAGAAALELHRRNRQRASLLQR